MSARARPRGLRFCFRIAVVMFEYAQSGFQALEADVEGRSLSKRMGGFSSQVDVTVRFLFQISISLCILQLPKCQDRRICFSVPCIQKREREDKKRTEGE